MGHYTTRTRRAETAADGDASNTLTVEGKDLIRPLPSDVGGSGGSVLERRLSDAASRAASLTAAKEKAAKAAADAHADAADARAMSWQRGELIGAGAFGRVYLGMNEQTGELMAVKQVRDT
jgi:serine/threonine protein kinase